MANDTTRCRILEAAGRIFADHGYEAATVRDICQKAQVNLAAVNYYFGGKERLYAATLARAHACRDRQSEPPEWPPGTPPAVKLEDYIRELLGHLLSVKGEPWEERLIIREIMKPTPAGRKLLREHFREGFTRLLGILDEILPADTPVAKRHQTAFSIIGQCVYYRAAGRIIPLMIGAAELKEHYDVEGLTAHVTSVCLAALGLGPPLAARGRAQPAMVE